MAISRGTFPTLLVPDLKKVFVETGKERPLEHPSIFNTPSMESNPEKDGQISGLGTMPTKPEGSMFALDQPVIGSTKTWTAVPYGLAVEFTREWWRDELYGIARTLSAGLKKAGVNKREVQAFSILNNAFSTSYTGFTASEALCATSHASFAGGSAQANRPTVDIGLSVTGLQQGLLAFEGQLDERGLPQLMTPSTIVIHQANRFIAQEILGSALKPFTANNEINSLAGEDLSVFVSHYLTSQTAWFLLAAKGVHSLDVRERDALEFDMFQDPWTQNGVMVAYQRFAEGWESWRGVYGSTG